jgi:TonB family protein
MVLIGSAFLPQPKPVEMVSFTLLSIPDHLIDEPNMIGGGNPKAGLPDAAPEPLPQPPAAQPQATPAQPPPQPPVVKPDPAPVVPEPAPRVKPVEPTQPKFNLAEATTTKPVPKPEVAPKPETSFDFSKATRKSIPPSPKADAPAEKPGPSQREAQMAAANQAVARMQKGLSGGIGEIGIPGPGGAAYASYNLALVKFYENHWITPQAYTDNEPVVTAEVTIRGDGTVLSFNVIKKANKRDLDRSVQITLERVKKVPPFPSGNKEETRTFRINFNLSSKLNLG